MSCNKRNATINKPISNKKLDLTSLKFGIPQSRILEYCFEFIRNGKSINEFIKKLDDKEIKDAFIQYYIRFTTNICSPLPNNNNNNIFPYKYVGNANKMNRYTLEVYRELFYQQQFVKYPILINLRFIHETAKNNSNLSNIDQDYDDYDDDDNDYIVDDNIINDPSPSPIDDSSLNIIWSSVRISNIRQLIVNYIKSNKNKNKKIEVIISLKNDNQMDNIHIFNCNTVNDNKCNIPFVSHQINNSHGSIIGDISASSIGICTISLFSYPFPNHYISSYFFIGNGNHLFGSRIFPDDMLNIIPQYFSNNDIEETKCYLDRDFLSIFANDNEYNNNANKFGVNKYINNKYNYKQYYKQKYKSISSGYQKLTKKPSILVQVVSEAAVPAPVPAPAVQYIKACKELPFFTDLHAKIIQQRAVNNNVLLPYKYPSTSLYINHQPFVAHPSYPTSCAGNFWMHTSLTNKMMSLCSRNFCNDSGLAFSYFKASVEMQMIDYQLNIFDININIGLFSSHPFILINIDLYSKLNPNELIYAFAIPNAPNKIAKWKIVDFIPSSVIIQKYGVNIIPFLPKSSRVLHDYANKEDVSSRDIDIESVLNQTIFKRIPTKTTTKKGRRSKHKKHSFINKDIFFESILTDWNNDFNQYLIPVLVVKGGFQFMEYKRFIRSIAHDNKYFAVSFRKLNDNYTIECIDFNMDRIFYQHLLIANTNKINYNLKYQYNMID